MSTNYNFIPTTLTTVEDVTTDVELPIFKELAYDFKTGQLKLKGDSYYYVEKNEALKIWIYKALFSSRYTYLAYSTDYGNEIYTLFGRYLKGDLLYSELRRMIEECLLCNPYLLSISDFTVEQDGSRVVCTFGVNTVYGYVAQSYNYEV